MKKNETRKASKKAKYNKSKASRVRAQYQREHDERKANKHKNFFYDCE